MLATHTQVLCLADLEQQIFDYLPGVGPERVIAIRAALKPHEIDLGTQNHRSPDSEILAFGNDILTAKPRGAPYKGVSALAYRPEKPPPNWNHLLRRALGELLKSIRAQSDKNVETIAILVTNNRSALKVSNALNALGANVGKPVRHKLLFDEAEALLSARFAAFLLEPKDLAQLEADVATSMEMIAAARRATGQGRKEVAKLLEQANKIKGGKALNINIANALARPDFRLGSQRFQRRSLRGLAHDQTQAASDQSRRTYAGRCAVGLLGRVPSGTSHLGCPL